ncbi:MAG TPA: cytochrome c oxidase subunit 4, partial [Candidatus Limnocylindrales bacterium]
MTEEVRFFRRVAIYAVVVGVIYWFASYEWIGTTLLFVFGGGAGVATLLLWRGARERHAAEGIAG